MHSRSLRPRQRQSGKGGCAWKVMPTPWYARGICRTVSHDVTHELLGPSNKDAMLYSKCTPVYTYSTFL